MKKIARKITFGLVYRGIKIAPQSLVKYILNIGVARLSSTELEHYILTTIHARASQMSPDEALRFLFRLDENLYLQQGNMAVVYGDGVHTKHRHMKYHDFFATRISKDEQVMDIGCGIGILAHSIAERSQAQVVGIDIVPQNIETAKKRFSHDNIEFIVGDATKHLPNKSIDVVVLSNVLEHIPPSRPEFLQNVIRAIQPSRLLIRVPLFERDWRVPLKKELGVEWRLDDTHYTEYTLESFAEEMAEAKLITTHIEVRWGEIWAEVKVE